MKNYRFVIRAEFYQKNPSTMGNGLSKTRECKVEVVADNLDEAIEHVSNLSPKLKNEDDVCFIPEVIKQIRPI